MVGLTGGIGSGKSVVAGRLAAHGAVVVDSDRIAREVVAPGTDGLREVAATFGERVLRADGSLDREALGEVVFGDAEARARLEGIIHPRVRARSAQLTAEAAPETVVVNDVPLLVEVGLAPTYHLVVVVAADEELRVRRLVRDRGMTPEQARRRIEAQTGDEQRRAAADVLLVNDGSLDELHARVDALWRDRLLPYERNLRQRRAAPPPEPGTGAPGGPAGVAGTTADDPAARFARVAARLRHALRPAEPSIAPLDGAGTTTAPAGGAPGDSAPAGGAGTGGALAAEGRTPGGPVAGGAGAGGAGAGGAVAGGAAATLGVRLTVAAQDDLDALAERLAAAGFPPASAEGSSSTRGGPGEPVGGHRRHASADPGNPVELLVARRVS